MSQWKYNGLELEVDMSDADFQEKYEKAFNEMAANEKKVNPTGKPSEITRAYCSLFTDLFDTLFEKGTADKLFGGKTSTLVVDECYESFIGFCEAQTLEIQAKKQAFISKYQPNRQQRRSTKKASK